ncbi:ATP-binding cassette domain-containing protein, partial [Mycobacterium tuberculosis]|nr:ATP-binding cassette domain-containing protein [Mycobacterium tuberculosis]
LQGNGDGYQHPLFHPARQLMRILVKTLFRVAETDFSEQVKNLLSALSGGERLKAALACVLWRRETAQLLLLDEPTNHLDLASTQAIES